MDQEIKKEEKLTETDNTQIENKSTTTSSQSPEQETPEQLNWKKFREVREIERKQKLEAEKKAVEKEAEVQAYKAAMEAILNKPSNNRSDPIDNEEVSEDERIRKQVEAIIAERDRKSEEERRRLEQATMPQRLQQTYQDFNHVCTSDNLDYLEYHYPEIAQAFTYMPDGFDKWSQVYKAVKRFVPNTDSRKEAGKAEKNLSKPQAMSIPGKTQTGDQAPHQLDEKRKMDNWQRMQKVMRSSS